VVKNRVVIAAHLKSNVHKVAPKNAHAVTKQNNKVNAVKGRRNAKKEPNVAKIEYTKMLLISLYIILNSIHYSSSILISSILCYFSSFHSSIF
jgi:hypothetical protein